ncbi:hypothetical protein ACLOJK_012204 [Asimina triloba]
MALEDVTTMHRGIDLVVQDRLLKTIKVELAHHNIRPDAASSGHSLGGIDPRSKDVKALLGEGIGLAHESELGRNVCRCQYFQDVDFSVVDPWYKQKLYLIQFALDLFFT